MKAGRPSQTASMVAMVRALANDGMTSVPGFSDPVAKLMLSPRWSRAYGFVLRRLRRAQPSKRARSFARLDVIPLRVAAIDAELSKAVAEGAKQLVILGAGLDTRALRLEALANVDVFEVDHPSTQAFKRRQASALPALAKSVSYVSIDFERDSLLERLRAAGFAPEARSVWIWEGVVMYLTDAALRATLDDVGRGSAPGTTLLVHYHVPDPTGGRPSEQWMRKALLRFWQEPQIGLRTPETMAREVGRAGFRVLRDTGTLEWAQAFGATPPSGSPAQVARLLVARREG